jgi:hypothetical protein
MVKMVVGGRGMIGKDSRKRGHWSDMGLLYGLLQVEDGIDEKYLVKELRCRVEEWEFTETINCFRVVEMHTSPKRGVEVEVSLKGCSLEDEEVVYGTFMEWVSELGSKLWIIDVRMSGIE